MAIKLILSCFILLCIFNATYAGGNDITIKDLTKNEQAEMVSAHNDWRQKIGAPALTWSKTLANTAQQYATKLSQTGCTMRHSKNGHGENIYWASPVTWKYSTGRKVTHPQVVSATDVTKLWGNEVKDYNYKTNTCRKGAMCGHYTQIIWKDTTEVGCGKTMCADKAQIWVCNYNPPGNVVGQKPY